ncbi:hypothetical protein MATL_G00261850 [Megalops atlanticus]|uniref:Uncharacterized protein n=1 Tax=Megalops atlanticus TaxID=7932 RepID=A0A9D3P927_MEGAT|nr:hypothetical protein MATL_G00261850 [Megalops atlanticus]
MAMGSSFLRGGGYPSRKKEDDSAPLGDPSLCVSCCEMHISTLLLQWIKIDELLFRKE